MYQYVVVHSGINSSASVAENVEHGLKNRLYQHVYYLSEEVGERNFNNPDGLDASLRYIKNQFEQMGLETTTQQINSLNFFNVIAETKGLGSPDEILVIGAHYDTVWLSPGADDNASGIAAMLEIARSLAKTKSAKTIRFIAFVNEEQPFAETENMGSRFYARSVSEKKEKLTGMFSLEMMGYFRDKPASQQYPSIANWFYPDTADFIAFVSNFKSRPLLVESIRAYSRTAVINAEGLVLHQKILPDIRRSDHASFWDYNYPALMITDTADYRNQNYHSVGDVIGTLNFEYMAGVVSALTEMFKQLSK